MASSEVDKAWLRLARFLSRGPAKPAETSDARKILLVGGDRGTIGASKAVVEAMLRDDLLINAAGELALSSTGLARLKRASAKADPFQDQHREIGAVRIETPDGKTARAALNLAESPLAQLARRKAKNGRPFLNEDEWRAGERLRSDYTRGQIMPRMGANWIASVASSRRDGENGLADLTDAALASRQRVNRAIEAIGPELAGVLIDVCCFLKGLEQVEMERVWPARSAKVVLKTALGALHRHYDPEVGHRAAANRMLHWGTSDYRPKIR